MATRAFERNVCQAVVVSCSVDVAQVRSWRSMRKSFAGFASHSAPQANKSSRRCPCSKFTQNLLKIFELSSNSSSARNFEPRDWNCPTHQTWNAKKWYNWIKPCVFAQLNKFRRKHVPSLSTVFFALKLPQDYKDCLIFLSFSRLGLWKL